MWSWEGYRDKAAIYWEYKSEFDDGSPQSICYFSHFLEFVVRSALCKSSPALNAEPTEEGLRAAAGLPSESPKSVGMQTALKRLRIICPEVTIEEVSAISFLLQIRNAELHSSEVGVPRITDHSIIPDLYSAIVKIAKSMNIGVEDFVGKDDTGRIMASANLETRKIQSRVKSAISLQRDRFNRLTAVEKEAKRKGSFRPISAVKVTGEHLIAQICPACGERGYVIGTVVGSGKPRLNGDYLGKEVYVLAETFSCGVCDLTLSTPSELMAAGISYEHTSFDEIDPVEHLDIDVKEYVDVEEIVREYEAGHYYEMYMDE